MAEGRLPLSEVARLAGQLQATLERLALAHLGERSTKGRRPKDVAEAVRYELVAFKAGSAVLEMAPPEAHLMDHELRGQVGNVLFTGLHAIGRGATVLPPEFNSAVLDGLVRLTGGISPGSVHRLELSRGDEPVVMDDRFHEHVRRLRKGNARDTVTIVGRLHAGDFDPLALRCRIDTVETTVTCTFGVEMRETVLAAMDSMVAATGTADVLPDGYVRGLDLDELTVVDEARSHSLSELAEEQGVGAVSDVAKFATMPDIDAEEFGVFLAHALSSRA
jgi:hypothetical protein